MDVKQFYIKDWNRFLECYQFDGLESISLSTEYKNPDIIIRGNKIILERNIERKRIKIKPMYKMLDSWRTTVVVVNSIIEKFDIEPNYLYFKDINAENFLQDLNNL